MTHDEEVYPDPESFKPERFIKNGTFNQNVRDPHDIVFGFGRRCVLFRFTVLSSKTNPAPIHTLESVRAATWASIPSGCQSLQS
jgi:hypothetical protein